MGLHTTPTHPTNFYIVYPIYHEHGKGLRADCQLITESSH